MAAVKIAASKAAASKITADRLSSRKRLEELDSLKGISAIGIALFHHYIDFWCPGENVFYNIPLISQLSRYGWLLVELFFMLSGFTMYLGNKNMIPPTEYPETGVSSTGVASSWGGYPLFPTSERELFVSIPLCG